MTDIQFTRDVPPFKAGEILHDATDREITVWRTVNGVEVVDKQKPKPESPSKEKEPTPPPVQDIERQPNTDQQRLRCSSCGAAAPASTPEGAGHCPVCGQDTIFIPQPDNEPPEPDPLAGIMERALDQEQDRRQRENRLLQYLVFEKDKDGKPTGAVNCIRLARLLLDGDGRNYISTEDNQEIFSYNGSHYVPQGDALIKQRVQYYLGDEVRGLEHIKNEVVGYVRNNQYIDREQFNPPLHLINVNNGIYNLQTGELLPHSPDHYFLQKILVDYKPGAKIDKIAAFLEQTFNQEDIPILQEFLGDSLYRSHRYKKALILVGPTDTGKSQFLSLIGKFIGEKNVAHVPLDRLCHDKFTPVELYGKLINIRAELHVKTLRSIDMFLMLTGGDVIGAERKYQNGFNFRNYSKQVYSCNETPDSENKNDAYYNRWIPVECSNTIPKENQIPNYFETISTDEELSGLLNWALKGLYRLLKQGHYSHHRSIDEVREFMTKGKNPIRDFADQYIIKDPDAEITNGELYNSYRDFCKLMGHPIKDSSVFSKLVHPLLPQGTQKGETSKDGHKRVWRGITCTYVTADLTTLDHDSTDKTLQETFP